MSKTRRVKKTVGTQASSPYTEETLSRRGFLLTQGALALTALAASLADSEEAYAAHTEPRSRIQRLGCAISDQVFGIHNVQCFGAKGDEVTDDTDAIQAAIGSFIGSNGFVYFPPGNYIVTDTLLLDVSQPEGKVVSLLGSSRGNTRIIWRGPTDGTLLKYVDATHFVIRNLHFLRSNASPRSATTGIFLTSSRFGSLTGNALMEHVLIEGFEHGLLVGEAAGNAVSEMTYLDVVLRNNTIGATFRANNTLNHQFIGGGASIGNGIGYSFEATSSDFRLVNVSISGTGGVAMQIKTQDSSTRFILSVENVTSEVLTRFLQAVPPNGPLLIHLQSNRIGALNAPDKIAVELTGSDFNLVATGNYLYPDVQFALDPGSGLGSATLIGNTTRADSHYVATGNVSVHSFGNTQESTEGRLIRFID